MILDKIIEYVSGAETASAYNPTTPYTGGLPSKTVKKGSKGTDVKHVQNFLNWSMKAGLKVDGSCGKNTTAAIKKFQKRYKLKVDGVFGSQSKRKANEIIKKHAPTPTPTPPPAPTPTSTAKLLATASALSGKASTRTDAYWSALKKAFPNRSKWGSAAKAGRSCDVYVATVLRSSGLDKDCPRGLKDMYGHKPSNFTRFTYKNVTPKTVSQTGDIIIYKKKGGGGHACIRAANGIYQANNPKYYPHYTSGFKKLSTKRPTVIIWRAK